MNDDAKTTTLELRNRFRMQSWFQHLTVHQQTCALGSITSWLTDYDAVLAAAVRLSEARNVHIVMRSSSCDDKCMGCRRITELEAALAQLAQKVR